jgi:hypothetical protein
LAFYFGCCVPSRIRRRDDCFVQTEHLEQLKSWPWCEVGSLLQWDWFQRQKHFHLYVYDSAQFCANGQNGLQYILDALVGSRVYTLRCIRVSTRDEVGNDAVSAEFKIVILLKSKLKAQVIMADAPNSIQCFHISSYFLQQLELLI